MVDQLFKRTGGEDFPEAIKAMLSGPPKSGKTSFLGTVPGIVIADTEPWANNLQSVAHLNLPFVTINGLDDMHRLLFVLRDESLRKKAAESLGIEKIEAVAIDTLDSLQDIMKKERLRDVKQTQMLRDDWNWLKEQMESMILAFNSLPIHVIYCVHLKTKEIGKGDDARTIVLPGLDGAVAESIAGMVGYSLLSFRKQEVRQDGSPYTAYFIRTEGDQNYDYLGNRAAGHLPDVIVPDFKVLHDVVKASKAAVKNVAQPTAGVQTPVETPAVPAVPAPAAPATPTPPQAPAPAAHSAQITAGIKSGQAAAATPPVVEQPALATPAAEPQEAAQNPGHDGPPVDGGQPVNPAAMGHVKRVYDAIGIAFPEELVKGLTMDDARLLVKMWNASNRDALEGKGTPGVTPAEEIKQFLASMGWLAEADQQAMEADAGEEPAAPAPAAPTAETYVPPASLEECTTIKQVMAWVGEDLTRAQQAYDAEVAKDNARSSLVNALVNLGVKVQTPVQNNVAGQSPESPPAGVTPDVPAADVAPTEEQAVETVTEGLGGQVVGVEQSEDAPCEECGGPIDDLDIARLSKARFERWLDVEHYIQETKKPR